MAWVWYWDAEPAVPCTKINGRTRSSGMSGMDGPGSRPLPELEPEPLRQPASSVAMPSPRTSPALRRYARSEEHTSELQSRPHLVCRLLLEKKKKNKKKRQTYKRRQTR